jgi:hypothetical protein
MAAPTTMPICIRFLWIVSHESFVRHSESHENMTLPCEAAGVPFNQNTAGFASHMKKIGSMGKKNPTMRPCKTEEDVEGESARVGLSRESIHCSSNARACSSMKLI